MIDEPQEPAIHPHTHPDGIPCVEEFARLSTRALLAAQDPRLEPMAEALNALVAHRGWHTQALLTWMALLRRYAVPAGTDTDSVTCGMVLRDETGQQIDPAQVSWAPLFNMTVNSAVRGQGANLVACLTALREIEHDVQRLALTRSLAYAAIAAVESSDDDTNTLSVELFHLIGMAAEDVTQWEMVPLLVALCLAVSGAPGGDDDAATRALVTRVFTLDDKAAVAALVCAARALAYTTPPPGLIVTMPGPDGDGVPTGLVDWRDETYDIGRPPSQLTAVWAWRAADAVGRRDETAINAQMARAILAGYPGEFVGRATVGCLSFLAQTLQEAADGERGAYAPPPGHPG